VTSNSASVPNARFDRWTLSSSAVRFYMLARLRGYAAIVEKKKVWYGGCQTPNLRRGVSRNIVHRTLPGHYRRSLSCTDTVGTPCDSTCSNVHTHRYPNHLTQKGPRADRQVDESLVRYAGICHIDFAFWVILGT